MGWSCCFPLIVTIAPVGSDEMTSLPTEGICGANVAGHRKAATSIIFEKVLYLTLVFLPTEIVKCEVGKEKRACQQRIKLRATQEKITGSAGLGECVLIMDRI